MLLVVLRSLPGFFQLVLIFPPSFAHKEGLVKLLMRMALSKKHHIAKILGTLHKKASDEKYRIMKKINTKLKDPISKSTQNPLCRLSGTTNLLQESRHL